MKFETLSIPNIKVRFFPVICSFLVSKLEKICTVNFGQTQMVPLKKGFHTEV